MKKFLFILLILAVSGFGAYHFISLKQKQSQEEHSSAQALQTEGKQAPVYVNENKYVPKIDYNREKRAFNKQDTTQNCESDPAICAVDLAVKCTLNPKQAFCDKKLMPRFIFMQDPSLGRPTYIHYNVLKVHPIDAYTIEIQTESTCDGVWFGLCNGNIIYVANKTDNVWRIKEIYALETYY
ncbi:MAG: hypothetical protein PHE89_07105 [Alphaproteobacteria bacterium]|nr:hypothetical protein [Alphaproteobacteria bacterium]